VCVGSCPAGGRDRAAGSELDQKVKETVLAVDLSRRRRWAGAPATSVCLAVILLVLTGVAVASALVTRSSAVAADRSRVLVVDYAEARFAVSQEESLERKYRAEPGPSVRSLHLVAVHRLDTAMRQVALHAGGAERRVARDITGRNAAYVASVHALFDATDAHDAALALKIDHEQVDPVSTSLQDEVYGRALMHDKAAATAGSHLRRVETIALTATIGSFAFGLTLCLLVWRLRGRYERDATAQAVANAHEARHDSLTGLPNRLAFAEQIQAALGAGRSVGMVLLDLDRFKEVNDTLGHHHGDLLLQQIGPRMREVLRPEDIIARLGGDEFGLLLTDDTPIGADAPMGADAPNVAANASPRGQYAEVTRRAMEALTRPFLVDGLSLTVEGSAGIAVFPQDGTDVKQLVQRADIAMYVANKNHTVFASYDPRVDEHNLRKLTLLSELRRAVADNELVMHYQPAVDLLGGAVLGVEALVRWQHPVEGLLPPNAFIPLAEGSGFIHELTTDVLNLSLDQAARWAVAGTPLVVSVNISARCLLDSTLPDTVRRALSRTGVPADLLLLEITESAIMADPVRAGEVIHRLHDLGVHLSIDDFGTGYTSMSYLRDLPVDELKIDQSFVKRMLHDTKDAVIVRTSIDLAQRLGLRAVAEGVEDDATWRALQVLDCDAAQGYLFSLDPPLN